ncbi:DUF2934 domain-containing protein [Bradyrhizobium lablabi]|uniref:DUF2934 domain-containing protein n=1 Tax=Bradyrhizobium lablabi TaxID=722472 RepID=UPI001BA85E20|nr:DUF2934 domain-containing protein [Bradyrhizobium lablabi]MBR1120865.1 DUF2934 domain-containing protein [Bradyrhizobium lablabi]
MDDKNHPEELQRQLERATRLASSINDPTTVQRFLAFADELQQKLSRLLWRDRAHEAIQRRARELWEQAGRPTGRDLEFWLQAERELERENDPE